MPTLYLMLGYPGAGKTTTSKVIHKLTGAVHIWADQERHKKFKNPTHAHDETKILYGELNKLSEKLLAEGKSVIYDTNFNFYRDRKRMRKIAAKYGANTKLIWVQTPKEVAKQRATHPDHAAKNTYNEAMPLYDFKRLARHLQPPRSNELCVCLNGTEINEETVKKALKL